MSHTTHNDILSVHYTQKRNVDAIASHGILFQFWWYNLALIFVIKSVEAGVRLHARVFPAGLQSPCDLSSDLRGRWIRGQR
jgi:hypothetical protein